MARRFKFRLRYLGLAVLISLPLVAVALILVGTVVIPAYTINIKQAHEAVLREDLHTIRAAIDQYTVDNHKAPQTLDDLVRAGYLQELPSDPFTHRPDTWTPSQRPFLTIAGGIDNVHSGSQDVGTDGTTYNTW